MQTEFQPRDVSRRSTSKARAVSRKADRRAKSARLFLAFAFPAQLDSFGARV